MIDIFAIYRLFLFGFTIASFISVIKSLLQYKKYYDQLPDFLTSFVVKKGSITLRKQLQENQKELLINLVLLVILICLNLVMFWL